MNSRKTTVVLVHGANRFARLNLAQKWVTVLEDALRPAFNIFLPEMPNPESPDCAEWLKRISKVVELHEGDVCLVGHSLGGSIALQYVARSSRLRHKRVFAVAAPFWSGHDQDWQCDQFRLLDDDIAALSLCKIYLYHGTEDEIVPFSHMAEYVAMFPRALTRSYSGMSHINPSESFLRDLAADIKSSSAKEQ